MGLFKRSVEPGIDLRVKVDLREPTAAPFEFGFPTRCPSCGGRGYIDHIDPHEREQFEHCPSCFTKWRQTEDEVLALNA